MATIIARAVMISKDFATTYFMTSITGKRTTQKCKKFDWFLKSDFATKIEFIIYRKMTNSIFAFGKKKFLKVIINES